MKTAKRSWAKCLRLYAIPAECWKFSTAMHCG